MARAAILQIPGVNCEYETARALEAVGIEARIVRFNEPASVLSEFDAFVLPGGFAFQDRIRAGAVAAKLPAVERIARESESGKPVLGICNGAQVLVEMGIVPGIRPGRVELALAPNLAPRRPGYLCRWVHVRGYEGPGRAIFGSDLPLEETAPLPLAHGEGRFTTADPEVLERIERESLVLFRYVDRTGRPAAAYPDDPNGAILQAAGITNRAGNVLAFMPHPERAAWLRMMKQDWPGPWGARRRGAIGDAGALEGPGPGRFLFTSLAKHLGVRAREGAGEGAAA
jgi:phosphoribosylformylglycinamidine synthase I